MLRVCLPTVTIVCSLACWMARRIRIFRSSRSWIDCSSRRIAVTDPPSFSSGSLNISCRSRYAVTNSRFFTMRRSSVRSSASASVMVIWGMRTLDWG